MVTLGTLGAIINTILLFLCHKATASMLMLTKKWVILCRLHISPYIGGACDK